MQVSWTIAGLVACLCFCVLPTHGGIDLGLASGKTPDNGLRGGFGNFFDNFLRAMMDGKRNKSETDTNMREGLVETVFRLLSMRDSGFERMLDYGLDISSKDLSSLPAPSDMKQFIQDLVPFLERIIQEYLSDPGTLFQYGLVQNPFPTQKYPDAVQFPNGGGTLVHENQYAWGADFHGHCGIGVMVHSAGTMGVLGDDPAFPTVTLRDSKGEIIFQETFPELVVGIRSALIVGCDRSTSSAKVLLASIGDPGEFILLNVNVMARTMEISTRMLLPAEASSVRRMQRLDGNDQCHIIVAPLFNIGRGTFDPPVIYVVDVCNGLTTSRQIGFDASLALHSVWDFECSGDSIDDDDLKCWFNLITFRRDPIKAITIDLVPKLFFGGFDSIKNVFELDEITTSFNVDSSAFSLLPINEGSKALVCTLSGFIYQVFGVEGSDLGNLGNLAESLELGESQECQVCDSATKACSDVALPGLVDSTTYIWDTVHCGDYVFVGTLDLANIAGDLLFELLTGIVREIDDTIDIGPIDIETDTLAEFLGDFVDFAEASNSEILLAILEMGKSVVVSLFFEDVITPYDFGFDLWYIRYSDLEGSFPTFQPLTVNGFRGLEYEGGRSGNGGYNYRRRPYKKRRGDKRRKMGKSSKSMMKTKGSKSSKGYSNEEDEEEEEYVYGPVWPFNFRDPMEDGVRNMVCHTGVGGSHPTLVLGSTVYGDGQESSTFTLELGAHQ